MILRLFIISLLAFTTLFAADKGVSVKAKKVRDYVVVEAKNENPFSVSVTYTASYQNLKSDHKLPMLFVLKPYSHKEILRLHIEKTRFVYRAHYHWTIGSIYAKHDNSYIYRLPYKRGTQRMVAQGFNGRFTHFGPSRYAVDFAMPVGTGVYAARGGIVAKTKADSTIGGPTRAFIRDANYIIVQQSDGTLATYAHLKYHGVLVKAGQKVTRGELIGYSGKTGMARGPHLHFIVYKALDGKTRKPIRIKFISAAGVVTEPIKGRWYTAK